MNAQLHPGWFSHAPGKKPTQLDLVNSIESFSNNLRTLGDLLMCAEDAPVEMDETIGRAGTMLNQMAGELDALLRNFDGSGNAAKGAS